MTCNDAKCDSPAERRGYCLKHYMHFYRYGANYADVPACRDCGNPTGSDKRVKRYCDDCAIIRIRQDRIRANNRRRSRSGKGDHYTIQILLDLDGQTCYLCGTTLTESPSIDHVIALSLGGTDTVDNVALTHWECNNRKKAKNLDDTRLEFPHMAIPSRIRGELRCE